MSNKTALARRRADGSQPQGLKRAHGAWQRGVKYAKSGDWARAELAFLDATRGSPEDPVYVLNLARAQMKNGRFDMAQRSAMTALALDPDSLIAREIAALCLKQQNQCRTTASPCPSMHWDASRRPQNVAAPP